jgi:23S rRNA (guanosine2251-2'-O)-methyltransferase
MRESYRAKQARKARINREKEEKNVEKKNKQRYNKNEFRTTSKENNFKSEKPFDREEKLYEDIVSGRNAVLELLKSNKDINKLYIERGDKHGSISEIIARANEKKIVLVEVSKQKLDLMAENHQGVVASVPPFNYCDVDDILEFAKSKNEDPFIVILDGIEDVHNLGAIIRTAETAGCHGIIIPKRRNVQVNSTVSKVSAGATTYVKVARVNNLNETIRYLKEKGLWIIGTDGEATTYYYDQDLKGPLAIIIGSEGFGMSNLVKQNTDILIKIPMFGEITSLNASVSAGIVIYEAVKQRKA